MPGYWTKGFVLLRGNEDQASALRADQEFQRHIVRADLTVQRALVLVASGP